MNTTEAYNKWKQGFDVRVFVTNEITNEKSIHAIDKEAWEKRIIRVPDNTNYIIVLLET